MLNIIKEILEINNMSLPKKIERLNIGHGNYVYLLDYIDDKKIVRLNNESNLYNKYKTYQYWTAQLKNINIPVTEIIKAGSYESYNYIFLECIEGKDLGEVYKSLTEIQKMNIAKDIINIQKQVQEKLLPNNKFGSIYRYNDNTGFSTWKEYILNSLENSKQNIKNNKIFDEKKVDNLTNLSSKYNEYFNGIEPRAFLDDISNKNLMICDGSISGIVDLDWMGFGDLLYFVGYTNMSLLDMQVDTDYVNYIIVELKLNEFQKKIVLFYTLVFCVDFMSEKGKTFQDKKIYVDEQIIKKLNDIYDYILKEIYK